MKPFLTGRKTLTASPLQAPHVHKAGTAQGSVKPAPAAEGGPTVEVIKQGDKVTRILVTCTCGERIEVDCLYPAGS